MTIRKLALGPILHGATVLIPGDGADPLSFEIRPHHHHAKLAGQRWHLLLVKGSSGSLRRWSPCRDLNRPVAFPGLYRDRPGSACGTPGAAGAAGARRAGRVRGISRIGSLSRCSAWVRASVGPATTHASLPTLLL